MKKFSQAGVAIVAALGAVPLTAAHAVPPTVTPSPGYDARLQEQRAATAQPATPMSPPLVRRHRNTRTDPVIPGLRRASYDVQLHIVDPSS